MRLLFLGVVGKEGQEMVNYGYRRFVKEHTVGEITKKFDFLLGCLEAS